MKNIKAKILLFIGCILIVCQIVPASAEGEGVRVYNSANISIPNETWTRLTFNSEYYDTYNFHSVSSNTGRIVAQFDGIYVVSCHVSYAGNVTGRRYVALWWSNISTYIAIQSMRALDNVEQNSTLSVATTIYTPATQYFECWTYQDSGAALNVLRSSAWSPEFAALIEIDVSVPTCTPQPTPTRVPTPTPDPLILNHHTRHEDAGADEINVLNLSGILADPQDAGWFHGLAITTTGVADDQVLAWDPAASLWQPETISGGLTMSDVITAVISGTVTVLITDTYHFTQTLSSGNDIAVMRTFSYGEATIAIGLFILLATIGIVAVFWFMRR